jgi:hypothetical protein
VSSVAPGKPLHTKNGDSKDHRTLGCMSYFYTVSLNRRRAYVRRTVFKIKTGILGVKLTVHVIISHITS